MNEISEIESTLDWWREAGVDTIVSDEPKSWLKASKKSVAKAAATQPSVAARAPLPDDLSALQDWLRVEENLPLAAEDLLDPIGDPASGLMILVDMPEQGDREAKQLMSGETGKLFDRMLAAIGRDRASVYLVPLCPARIAGGTINDDLFAELTRIARHHVMLTAPKMLLLMGDSPTRVFCEMNLNEARGKQQNVNHDGGSVTAIATFHPRFLLQQPKFKAESWKDLQMLTKGMLA